MATQRHRKSPYIRMRRRLFALCGQEFEPAPNIWLVYSWRTDRQWVLRSDLQYLHFLAIEFNADVLKFDLAPAPAGEDTEAKEAAPTFDAVVTFRDGHKEYRRMRVPSIDSDGRDVPDDPARFERAAAAVGGTYRLIRPDTLEPKRVRIQNSLRMLRFISAARQTSLVSARNSVMAYLKGAPAATLQSLVDQLHDAPPAEVLAAAFQLVGRGRVQLDMDRDYVALGTLVRAAP